MSNIKIEMNLPGLYALRNDPGLMEVLEAEAGRMTRATGMTYEPDPYHGPHRANAGGYRKGQWKICPKCGEAHPNCTCN